MRTKYGALAAAVLAKIEKFGPIVDLDWASANVLTFAASRAQIPTPNSATEDCGNCERIIRQLRCGLRVARLGWLNFSASTLTLKLGFPLFDRHKGGIGPADRFSVAQDLLVALCEIEQITVLNVASGGRPDDNTN